MPLNLSVIGKRSEPVENPVNILVTLNFCVACDIPALDPDCLPGSSRCDSVIYTKPLARKGMPL
jgi:hypothetical protein